MSSWVLYIDYSAHIVLIIQRKLSLHKVSCNQRHTGSTAQVAEPGFTSRSDSYSLGTQSEVPGPPSWELGGNADPQALAWIC